MRFDLVGLEELQGSLRHALTPSVQATDHGPLFVQVSKGRVPFVCVVQLLLGQRPFPLRLLGDGLQALLKSGEPLPESRGSLRVKMEVCLVVDQAHAALASIFTWLHVLPLFLRCCVPLAGEKGQKKHKECSEHILVICHKVVVAP